MESLFLDHRLFLRHARNSLGKEVVDDVGVLLVQLVEEELDQITNPKLLVLEQESHVSDLGLELEHAVQNEVSDDHKRCLSHVGVLVTKAKG